MARIWQYSNVGVTSWHDFSNTIIDIQCLPCRVQPIETKDFPTTSQRPPLSVLNKSKIKSQLGIDIPHWRESLVRCLNVLDR